MILSEVIDKHRARIAAAWPSDLAALYETRSRPARKRHLAIALGLLTCAEVVASVLDHMNAPPLFTRALTARCLVAAVSLAGALAIWRTRPGLPEGLAFGTPLLAQVVLSAWTNTDAPAALVDRNIIILLILLAAFCAIPPMSGRMARSLAALLSGYFVATLWVSEGTSNIAHNVGALAAGAAALCVGVGLAFSREQRRRTEFLQVLATEQTAADLRLANAELERLMNTDVLTGVANRRRFETDMRSIWQMLGQLENTGIGLIIADVDHFKLFNDAAGHAEGDACLRAIAAAISDVVRDGAAGVARWGGEEFVVLAPAIPRRHLDGLAERVRAAVAALALPHPAFPGRHVTVSVGAAWCGGDSPCGTPDDLLHEADRALYAAKKAGRDRCVVASEVRCSEAWV